MTPQQPLIILGSARRQSDTARWLDFVFEGLDHRMIDLLDYTISPYSYDDDYPEEDAFLEIAEAILDHDTIVFATPVYWYAMSSMMKTLFDRITDLVTIRKKMGRQLKGKSIFLLAVGSDAELPEGFEIPFRLTANYLDMHYKLGIYFSMEHPKTEAENLLARKAFVEEIAKSTRA